MVMGLVLGFVGLGVSMFGVFACLCWVCWCTVGVFVFLIVPQPHQASSCCENRYFFEFDRIGSPPLPLPHPHYPTTIIPQLQNSTKWVLYYPRAN